MKIWYILDQMQRLSQMLLDDRQWTHNCLLKETATNEVSMTRQNESLEMHLDQNHADRRDPQESPSAHRIEIHHKHHTISLHK